MVRTSPVPERFVLAEGVTIDGNQVYFDPRPASLTPHFCVRFGRSAEWRTGSSVADLRQAFLAYEKDRAQKLADAKLKKAREADPVPVSMISLRNPRFSGDYLLRGFHTSVRNSPLVTAIDPSLPPMSPSEAKETLLLRRLSESEWTQWASLLLQYDEAAGALDSCGRPPRGYDVRIAEFQLNVRPDNWRDRTKTPLAVYEYAIEGEELVCRIDTETVTGVFRASSGYDLQTLVRHAVHPDAGKSAISIEENRDGFSVEPIVFDSAEFSRIGRQILLETTAEQYRAARSLVQRTKLIRDEWLALRAYTPEEQDDSASLEVESA